MKAVGGNISVIFFTLACHHCLNYRTLSPSHLSKPWVGGAAELLRRNWTKILTVLTWAPIRYGNHCWGQPLLRSTIVEAPSVPELRAAIIEMAFPLISSFLLRQNAGEKTEAFPKSGVLTRIAPPTSSRKNNEVKKTSQIREIRKLLVVPTRSSIMTAWMKHPTVRKSGCKTRSRRCALYFVLHTAPLRPLRVGGSGGQGK